MENPYEPTAEEKRLELLIAILKHWHPRKTVGGVLKELRQEMQIAGVERLIRVMKTMPPETTVREALAMKDLPRLKQ